MEDLRMSFDYSLHPEDFCEEWEEYIKFTEELKEQLINKEQIYTRKTSLVKNAIEQLKAYGRETSYENLRQEAYVSYENADGETKEILSVLFNVNSAEEFYEYLKEEIEMENRKNSNDNVVKCPICSKNFNSIDSLITHLISHETEEREREAAQKRKETEAKISSLKAENEDITKKISELQKKLNANLKALRELEPEDPIENFINMFLK